MRNERKAIPYKNTAYDSQGRKGFQMNRKEYKRSSLSGLTSDQWHCETEIEEDLSCPFDSILKSIDHGTFRDLYN